MEAPKPTAKQAEEAERLEAISLDGQVREFRDAVKQALTVVNQEIQQKDGQPAVDAVQRALISVMAEFIAMAPDRRARRLQIREVEIMLPKLVSLRVQGGGD